MKAVEYVKETKVELKHVAWPTKKQAVLYTVLVIVVSVLRVVCTVDCPVGAYSG